MTIYVLENRPLVREAIVLLLHRIDSKRKVIGVDAFSGLKKDILINGHPEAFVMTPFMTDIHGSTTIGQLKKDYPIATMIFLSDMPKTEVKAVCINAGGDFFVDTDLPFKNVCALVRNNIELAKAGGTGEPFEAPASADQLQLTRRQKQLVVLVDAGLGNEEIASRLNINNSTVKVHLSRLYKKLNIKSRTQLTKFARENGYL